MADYAPNYSFNAELNPSTGETKYFYTNNTTQKKTELQDADAYNRLKAKFNTVTDQGFNDVTQAAEQDAGFTQDDTAQSMRARRAAMQQKPLFKSAGGKISLGDCKVNTTSKNKASPNW